MFKVIDPAFLPHPQHFFDLKQLVVKQHLLIVLCLHPLQVLFFFLLDLQHPVLIMLWVFHPLQVFVATVFLDLLLLSHLTEIFCVLLLLSLQHLKLFSDFVEVILCLSRQLLLILLIDSLICCFSLPLFFFKHEVELILPGLNSSFQVGQIILQI